MSRRRPTRWQRRWLHEIDARDPLLASLRLALRSTIGAALTGLALPPLASWAGQGLTMTLTGIFTALMAPLVVDDATVAAQKRTTLLLLLPTAAASLIGAVAAPSPWASGILFMVAVFAAVAARRYGPRANALGAIGFMSYFLTLYLRPDVRAAAWGLPGVGLALAISYATRFVVVRDPGLRALVHGARSFHAQIILLLDDLIGASAPGKIGLADAQRRQIRREMALLNEAALGFEDLTARLTAEGLLGKEAADQLRYRRLETELAAELLAATVMRRLDGGADDGARAATIAALRQAAAAVIVRWRQLMRYGMTAMLDAPKGMAASAALDEASRVVAEAPGEKLQGAVKLADGGRATLFHRGGALPPMPAAGGMNPHLRQALQATLACGLAMLGGRLVSADRWPWAVLTAYVVYTGSSTRSETIVRAWQRLVGTVAGIVAGFATPMLLHGHADAQLLLAFACIFAGTYTMKRSYALMVFFFTAQLGILYELMGRFTPEILVLRLEETLLGALLGVAVAALVMPAHGTDRLRLVTVETLEALAGLLQKLAGAEAGGRAELISAARALDRRMLEVRTAARSLTEGPFAPFAASLARAVQTLSALVFYGRQLAYLGTPVEGLAVAQRLAAMAAALRAGGEPKPEVLVAVPEVHAGAHQVARMEQLLAEMRAAIWGDAR